jgi:osmotically-inducible protein OsmY
MRRDSLIMRVTTQARASLLSAMVVALLACPAFLARADGVAAPANTRLDAIVVTAKKRSDPVPDEKMKQQVEEALHSDAYFYDGHVTVTIKDGVATLQGIVFDDWDLRQAMRIARKVPGVRRVVNDLEIKLGGE